MTERERSQAAVRRLAAPAAWVVAAFVFWLVHGGGTVGYDAFFELLWGDEVAQGVLPHYGPRSPTPHPLGIAVATVLAPLGDDDVLAARRLVSLLAFAGLGWAAFSLGRAAFSRAVGVVFAGIVLTRPPLLGAALNASIDVPFVALVLAAATLEIRRPRCSTRVLLVLAAAGLLRPEAWPLAGAYALAMASRAPWPQRARLAALAVIAPAVWTAFDLVVTGDPFYSLHATRTNAERSQDAGGPLEALAQAAASFRGILYPVVAVGAGGCGTRVALPAQPSDRAADGTRAQRPGLRGHRALGRTAAPALRLPARDHARAVLRGGPARLATGARGSARPALVGLRRRDDRRGAPGQRTLGGLAGEGRDRPRDGRRPQPVRAAAAGRAAQRPRGGRVLPPAADA